VTKREGDRIKEREEEKSETHTIDSETEKARERERERERTPYRSVATNCRLDHCESKFKRISHACVLIAKVHHRHVGQREREGGWVERMRELASEKESERAREKESEEWRERDGEKKRGKE